MYWKSVFPTLSFPKELLSRQCQPDIENPALGPRRLSNAHLARKAMPNFSQATPRLVCSSLAETIASKVRMQIKSFVFEPAEMHDMI